jgi:DNA-binding IclR family transcriptional regulator
VLTDDNDVINIDGINSPQRVRNVGWIGREMPIHAVSGGKVMMAYMPHDELAQILDGDLQRFTIHTITESSQLKDELEQIRKKGFGVAVEELETGLCAVAAPIWNHERQAVGIISVSGPSFRLPRERLLELGTETKLAADTISRKLGYVPNGYDRARPSLASPGSVARGGRSAGLGKALAYRSPILCSSTQWSKPGRHA